MRVWCTESDVRHAASSVSAVPTHLVVALVSPAFEVAMREATKRSTLPSHCWGCMFSVCGMWMDLRERLYPGKSSRYLN